MKRENEKHKFINKFWYIWLAISLTSFIAAGCINYAVGHFYLLYALGAIALLDCVIMPTHYVMDNTGIYVYYLFYFKMEYRWHNIWHIYKAYNLSPRSMLYFGKSIEFSGSGTGPKIFDFLNVEISYNRRAKELIEKYTQTEIDDYTIAGDIKNFKKKREQKKLKKQNRHHKKKKK
ncbi:MAG: hypothetical protein IJ447_04680 [Clostridia bacterium]|nr:hypothetical protein [Clostridia bacterium]